MTHEEVAYRQGRDSVIEALCDWMIERGLATGHGENLSDVLHELGEQIAIIRRQRDDLRDILAGIGRQASEVAKSYN